MAENGRRDVVGDVLAINVGNQAPQRDLQTMGVRNPNQSGGQNEIYAQAMDTVSMVGQLGSAIEGVMKTKEDEWLTEGQLQYMQGATEAQIAATGNKFTMQGWQSLNTVDAANRWYSDELVNIQNGAREMSPEAYSKLLMEKRGQFLGNLPEDPAIRKMYAAAFADQGPRLAAQQVAAHNEYNLEETRASLYNLADSQATHFDTPRINGQSPIAMSNGVVRSTIEGYTDYEIDRLTRTVLGEAGGEGPTGMAGVAHVAINRVIDGGYGGRTLTQVLTPSQFNGLVGSEKYDPNSGQYQRARGIVMDVLSGHNVDPTGGRTHFVSGGIRPNWWESERAKGDTVVIGGHEYVGLARNLGVGQSSSTGALNFANPGEENISPGFANILSNSATQLGTNFGINSGARSKDHNRKVGGVDDSSHVKGEAVDIDMAGMGNEESANLVRTLRANGALRFSTYSDTNHLHVDMNTMNGENGWFMHDETNDKLGDAPDWFKAVSAEAPAALGSNVAANQNSDPTGVAEGMGIPTANTVSIAQTQTQDLWRSINAPKAMKAEVLTDKLISTLGAGDSTLWDSTGGEVFLREFGATPVQIRQVQAAKTQYDTAKMGEFNLAREQRIESVVQAVREGGDPEVAYADIQAMLDEDLIDDKRSTALTQDVLAQARQRGEIEVTDPGFMRGMSTIYERLKNPETYTAEQAQADMDLLALQYDVPETQVRNLVGSVWSKAQSEIDAIQTKIDAATRTSITRDQKLSEINQALAGNGLGRVTGTIDMQDGKGAQNAQQYGVEQRWNELVAVAKESAAGYTDLTPEEQQTKAMTVAQGILFKELINHGNVVQQGLADSMTSSLSGAVASATFEFDAGMQESFDTYMRMNLLDPTGTYAGKYLQSDQASRFMLNTMRFYDGGFGIETSMKRAHEFMRNGLTVENAPDITKIAGFDMALSKAVGDNFQTLMGADWLGSTAINAGDSGWARAHPDQLTDAVSARAWAYYAENSAEDYNVAIKLATQHVVANSSIIGGNIMTPRDAGGVPVAKQMGLEKYGQDIPQKAVEEYLREYATSGASPEWKRVYESKEPNLALSGVPAMGLPPGVAGRVQQINIQGQYVPPFHASWNQDGGTLRVQLWENNDRKALVPYETLAPMELDLAEVGEWYRNKHEVRGSNAFQDMWGSIFGGSSE